MPVFVNRTLNLKKISMIGFDMDYTLVGYHTRPFENLVYDLAKRRLIEAFGYPKSIQKLQFDFDRAIVGLVIDLRNGYMLQLSRYSKVKLSYFGLDPVPFRKQNEIYQNMAIDLKDPNFQSLDTSFAISTGVLFSQLVQLKKEGLRLPVYSEILRTIGTAMDQLHQDGTLKDLLQKDFGTYVKKDPAVAMLLERYKDYHKKLMIITNSDYAYTRKLLDYAIDPYLKHHSSWQELFDIVITLADKPRFFERKGRFLRVDPETGLMRNHEGPITPGIYQGGCSTRLQQDLGLQGNEILYLGDHIYGDVVSIKKNCNWRTALVLADLEREMEGIRDSYDMQQRINSLMNEKNVLEMEINRRDIERYEHTARTQGSMDQLYRKIDKINNEISTLLGEYLTFFNPYWGEVLRAGSEESRYADQVERYACIYMTKVSDLYDHSPRTYFRPIKRIMPHELAVEESLRRSDAT
ncbi:MAG: HAD-IG family 5'-nucleotidase [Spirochaetia bacterium]|nr:HAD-IG family 5'-nucleotidase [Spirochaetia bacterium]MCF7941360.1 HAD-IG family 5'-nucleotidase [Spirochaetia bacterium]